MFGSLFLLKKFLVEMVLKKFEKSFSKIRLAGVAAHPKISSNSESYCLISKGYGRLTREELEAVRRVIRRRLRKYGTITLRVFPTVPVTKKPLQARMGKGKGRVDNHVAFVYPGKVLLELGGVSAARAYESLIGGSHKLSLPVFVCALSSVYG